MPLIKRVIAKLRTGGPRLLVTDGARSIWKNTALFCCNAALKTRFWLTGGEFYLLHNGTRFLFSNSGDRQELLYHYGWRRYQAEETTRLAGVLTQGAVVADVGANLGFFTLLINQLCTGNVIVHCFEPSPGIFARLQKNIAANNLACAVLHNVGCGEAAAEMEIVIDAAYSGMSSLVLPVGEKSRRERISIVRLDDYLAPKVNRLDLIKIDTEGYEPQVLRGAEQLIKRFKPLIYIELGGGKFYGSSCRALQVLTSLGYTVPVTAEQLRTVPAGVNFLARYKG